MTVDVVPPLTNFTGDGVHHPLRSNPFEAVPETMKPDRFDPEPAVPPEWRSLDSHGRDGFILERARDYIGGPQV